MDTSAADLSWKRATKQPDEAEGREAVLAEYTPVRSYARLTGY